MIRAVIADDEPLARDWLSRLLAGEPGIEVVAEASNGEQAIEQVERLRPDLLFLDVEMPELDGFAVVSALGDRRPEFLVFVTAYDRYAIQAFDVHAIDYLLKPFDRDRLRKTLDRIRSGRARGSEALSERLRTVLESFQARRAHRIAVKDGGKVFFVRMDEIDWIGACGNYVEIHAGKATHLLLQTMNGMEARLDPERFLRIHRSTIVNVDQIHSIEPNANGDCTVYLRDGTTLGLSRGYRERLQSLLGRLS